MGRSRVQSRRKLIETMESLCLTTKERCVVWALCRNDLRTKPAAVDLFYNPGSLIYQVEKIKEKTGLDPRNFYDAIELLEIIGKDPILDAEG